MGILQGKVALVTGGRRGIGRGICLALAAEGADVAVNDVEGAEQAEAVAQEVRDSGGCAMVAMADVAEPDQVQAMVDRVVAELGGLDILVNNAGVESIVPFLEITPEEWERVTNINLRGEFLCAQAAVRQMIAGGNGGSIVNIGSVQAGMVLPGRAHYAPSKRGVEALTANLAVELAEHNIRVNCINPGSDRHGHDELGDEGP